MKKTRKFAALVAAMMCISGMGAMSAFATDINENAGTSNTAKTDDIEMYIKAYASNNNSTTNGDEDDYIWNVTITADDLQWEVDQTLNAQTHLEWNPTTHTYNAVSTGTAGQLQSTALHSGETADKNVNVANNSNFALTPTVSITGKEGYSNATTGNDKWFTVSGDATSVTTANNVDITISLVATNVDVILDTSNFSNIATTTLTLTPGSLVTPS